MLTVKKLRRNREHARANASIVPRGIHHTVSYAETFNDTWDHIQNELKKTYQHIHLQ